MGVCRCSSSPLRPRPSERSVYMYDDAGCRESEAEVVSIITMCLSVRLLSTYNKW